MRNPLFLTLLLLVHGALVFGQRKNQKPVTFNRHYNEILPHAPQFELNGWTFGLGGTYMLARTLGKTETIATESTYRLDAKYAPIGKPALYAEFGRYKMLKYSKWIKYVDYGLSYKGLRGMQKTTFTTVDLVSGNTTAEEVYRNNFGYHFAEAYANANHVWRISKYNFIQNSIGLNGGYAFLAKENSADLPNVTSNVPKRYQMQLHYKLGFGIKMRGNWLIIPTLETPILTALPFDKGKSSMHFFTSRYRPLIFGVRIMLMKPADTMKCTPVKTKDGTLMPSDMDKQGQLNQTR